MANISKTIQTSFFLGLLGCTLILVALMFVPFLGAIVLAITLAIIFDPIYSFILRITRKQRSVAALLTILVVLIIVLIPTTLFGIRIFSQAQSLYSQIAIHEANSSLSNISSSIENLVNRVFPSASFSLDLKQTIQQFFQWILKNIGPIFSSVAKAFTMFLLGLLALYYLLKDGPKLKKSIIDLIPLSDRYSNMIFAKLKNAINSVIRGYLIIATVQGIIAGIGFTIFGLPNSALWGLVTVIAALVPILGTSLVVAPAVIYLFFSQGTATALGLLIWGVVAVSLVDNFLGPKLISRKVNIHPIFILISVLGGISLFGPIGFLIGPISIALLFSLLEIYPLLLPK